MGLFGFFSSGLTDRKVSGVRKRFWSEAKREATRCGRNEVWYADVLACCLNDPDARAAVDASATTGAELQKLVVSFQNPDERSDVSARSGAFVLTENEFSWPLDRALDRAVAACRARSANTLTALDVLIGAISPDEQDLAKHIVPDCYALHLALTWQVAHPDVEMSPAAPSAAESKLVLHPDPFTPAAFVKRQLTMVPQLDDQAMGGALEAFDRGEPTTLTQGDTSLLTGIVGHVRRERELAGHPLRLELEPA